MRLCFISFSANVEKSTAEALQKPPGVYLKENSDKSSNSHLNKDNKNDSKDKVCLTAGCVHAASNALEAIDNTIEPCDDFYNYACGNFLKNTMIPDEKVSVNTFSIIGDKLQEQLRALISDETKPGESKPFTLAKNLYKACMNKTLIEDRGLKPVFDKLETLGGWPVLKGDRWDDDSSWDWQQAVKNFRKVGYSMDYIFDFSVGVDLKKSVSRTIDVSLSVSVASTPKRKS